MTMTLYPIAVPVANLFRYPDETSEVVSQALYGWTVEILRTERNFYQVRTSDQYEGWVTQTDVFLGEWIKHSFSSLKTIRNAAHLYPKPTVTQSKPLLTLPFEVELPIVEQSSEEEGRWIQVLLVDGRKGWIQKGDITFNPTPCSWKESLTLRRQFLGLPYTWGGVSSFGYDCSGYTQMLARQAGIALPRDAKDQIGSPLFEAIQLEEAVLGDFLFFGPHAEKITHVGVIDQPGQLIHASVKPIPTLQLTSLTDSSLTKRFSYWTARRLKRVNKLF